MKKISIFIATILSATILFGAVLPASAASAEVTIEVEATEMDNVSVVVPTTLPIIFNADGTNTLPTAWTIENKSQIAGIHLSQIDMKANSSGWKLLSEETDTSTLPADSKAIQFYVKANENVKLIAPTDNLSGSVGKTTYEKTELVIPSGKTQVLGFEINRGAFTQNLASAKAFDMILTFEFN